MVVVIPRSEEQKRNVVNAAYEDMVAALIKLKREDLIPKCDRGKDQLLNCEDRFIFEKNLNHFYNVSFYFQDQLGKRGKLKIPKTQRAKKSKKESDNRDYKSDSLEQIEDNPVDPRGIIKIVNKPLGFETRKQTPLLEDRTEETNDGLEKVKKEVEAFYDVYKDGFGLAYLVSGLPKSEIKPKIESLVPTLSQKYDFKDPEYKWLGNGCSYMSFSFKAKGQEISGDVHVFNQALFIGGKLPFLAKFYKNQIEDTIKKELDLIFKKQS